jgi:very-short-patch-repair endonuclease
MITKNQKKKSKAQTKRNAETKNSEAYLWILLHNKKLKGNKFYKHYKVGEFYVDFYCPDASLAVILDANRLYADLHPESCCELDKYLESVGINVLHIDSKTIQQNSKQILDKIISEISASAICESLKLKVDKLEVLSLN